MVPLLAGICRLAADRRPLGPGSIWIDHGLRVARHPVWIHGKRWSVLACASAARARSGSRQDSTLRLAFDPGHCRCRISLRATHSFHQGGVPVFAGRDIWRRSITAASPSVGRSRGPLDVDVRAAALESERVAPCRRVFLNFHTDSFRGIDRLETKITNQLSAALPGPVNMIPIALVVGAVYWYAHKGIFIL